MLNGRRKPVEVSDGYFIVTGRNGAFRRLSCALATFLTTCKEKKMRFEQLLIEILSELYERIVQLEDENDELKGQLACEENELLDWEDRRWQDADWE